jgi:hypothetical protein
MTTKTAIKVTVLEIATRNGLKVLDAKSKWCVIIEAPADGTKLTELYRFADRNGFSFAALCKYRKTSNRASTPTGLPVAWQVDF